MQQDRPTTWGKPRIPLILLAITIGSAGSLRAGDAVFQEQALARGLQEADTVTRAAAWEDFDRDGDLDVAFGDLFFANRIYRNDGDGTFTDVSEAWGIDPALIEDTYGVVVADYDNDGDGDLYFTNGGFNGLGVNRLYRNDLETLGLFTEVSDFAGIGGDPSYNFAASWFDFDGDGWLDLFVHKRFEASRLYRNQRNGTFESVEFPGIVWGVNGGANGACAADYDNDGDIDLLVPQYDPSMETGGLVLLQNDGLSQVLNVTVPSGLGAQPRTFTCAADDFNQDGWMDVYVGTFNLASDPVKAASALWVNDGDGTFTAAPGVPVVASNIMGLQSGDLNGDGFPDLFIGRGDPEVTGTDLVFLNTTVRGGEVTFADVTDLVLPPVEATRTHGTNFVDVDRDGRMDIFVGTGGNMPTTCEVEPCALPGQEEPNRLFVRTGGPDWSWLRYRLVGMLSNRDAIGARLFFQTDAGTFHRHVSGGNGFNNMNPLEALAGLGAASQVLRVWVRWPSGIYQQIPGPALGETHVWEETGIRAGWLPAGDAVEVEVVGPSGSAYEIWGSETLSGAPQPAGVPLLGKPFHLLGTGNLDAELPGRRRGVVNLAKAEIPIPAMLRDGRPLHFQARVLLPDGWYPTNVSTVNP